MHKLLVYESGSHFAVAHRGTVKVEGMFGTLVVVLPSVFKGGELSVSHGGATRNFDLSGSGALAILGCVYADCEHSVSPVTAGVRVVLTFNLLYSKKIGEVEAVLTPLRTAIQKPLLLFTRFEVRRPWCHDTHAVRLSVHPLGQFSARGRRRSRGRAQAGSSSQGRHGRGRGRACGSSPTSGDVTCEPSLKGLDS